MPHLSPLKCQFIFVHVIFERPFVKRFALCYRTVVCPVCLSVLSVTLVYCGQTVGRIKMKLDTQVGFGPGHIVLDEDPAPSPPKREPSPQFLAHICCGQMVGWTKTKLGMQVGLGPGHIVLYGDPAALPKGAQPQSSAHICCRQMAGWINLPLGIKVDLGPGDFVLDGNPAPLPKKGRSPPMSIVAKRLDGTRCHLVRR